MEAKTLHLNLKKKWFDMILSGEKKEEYRDLSGYWGKRLTKLINFKYEDRMECYVNPKILFREFDTITFSNGYSEGRPQFEIELKEINIRDGDPEWGAVNGKKYFVLTLGKILWKQ